MTFDAVVGQLVLMYQPDPGETLARALHPLRSGDIVAFLEFDATKAGASVPPSPSQEQLWTWLVETMKRAGIERQMGFRLPSTFLAAGLPYPQLQAHAIIGSGPNWEGYEFVVRTFRSMLPMMEQLGVATVAEVEIDTLAARLRKEVSDQNGTMMVGTYIGD